MTSNQASGGLKYKVYYLPARQGDLFYLTRPTARPARLHAYPDETMFVIGVIGFTNDQSQVSPSWIVEGSV